MRNREGLGQPEGTLAVENAKVDRFGCPPHLGRDRVGRFAEDCHSGSRVDVVACFKCRSHRSITREVGEDSQLDLRVVGGHKPPA